MMGSSVVHGVAKEMGDALVDHQLDKGLAAK